MNFLLQPWPWYIAGPLIGLTVPLLLLLANKQLGISSSFRHLGAICTPKSRFPYLSAYNWRRHSWNLIFVGGVLIGAFLATQFLSAEPVTMLPESAGTPWGLVKLGIGGVLVGFGTRYANGCTSGHTIMGISMLNRGSMVATVFFFVGGLITTYLLGFIF
ncbi:MAG: YeeE/YedE thiosulfate transporter family protein [Ardenticatenaceae bacterium]|nr:YeeE/YedE thiosulfate transporter family protein [Ardenticatenaceae bacterium]